MDSSSQGVVKSGLKIPPMVDSSVSQAAASTGPLSRMSLYTSMAAYNNDRGLEPSEFMRMQQSTPKSLREATLTDFVQRVSHDFHRSLDVNFCKNTAGRPLSVPEIEDRLKQRALTLVGGGFNTPKPLSSSSKTGTHTTTTTRRRARCAARKQVAAGRVTLDPETYQSQMSFLAQLNQFWNEWAWEVLGGTVEQVTQTLSAESELELIGARVRFQAPHSVGITGIVTGETTNTWRVSEQRIETRNEPSRRLQLRTRVLPKDKTSLSILLPAKVDGTLTGQIVCIELNSGESNRRNK